MKKKMNDKRVSLRCIAILNGELLFETSVTGIELNRQNE